MFFCLIPFQNLIFPKDLDFKVNFEDKDQRGGWLSGAILIKDDSEKSASYEIYWGNNPGTILGNYRYLIQIPSKLDTPLNFKLELNELKIPPGATHLIFYSVYENNQKVLKSSYPIIDFGVPTSKAQNLSFQQSKREAGRIQGEVRIVPAFNERDIDAYAVYWGSAEDTVIRRVGSIAVVPKPGFFGSLWRGVNKPWTEPGYFLDINERLPPDATHLIAFTRNEEGQMSEGVSFQLEPEEDIPIPETTLKLNSKISEKGFIAGELVLERLKDESGFTHYLLAWGGDSESRLDHVPNLVQYEVRGIQDGVAEKLLKVETLGPMEQKLSILPKQGDQQSLSYIFPEQYRIPFGATHILLLTQQKFWFEEDAERKIGKVIASVPLDPKNDPMKVAIPTDEAEDTKDADLAIPPESKDQALKEPAGSDWRKSEYRGIGIGVSFSGLNSLVLGYDYNSGPDTQWHLQFDLTGPIVQNWFRTWRMTGFGSDMGNLADSASGSSLEISRSLVSLGYRWFVDPDWVWGLSEGLFYGAGVGYGTASLKYYGKYTIASSSISGGESFSATQTHYYHNASAQGMTLSLEAGWQGHENYIVHLALQPTFYVGYKDGYDETKIMPTLNHQSIVSERWKQTRNLNRITMGVGVFF